MEKLHIAMVHDIVCSWCPISYKNIQMAIKNLNIEVDFSFLPFQINPDMGDDGELITRYFSRQFNWSNRELLDYQQSLVHTAASAGVSIDFSKRTHYYNTYHAHLLMHWAAGFNKQTALNEALIKAYFNDGLNINCLSILLQIAEDIGLDREKANTALSSAQLKQTFDDKTQRYREFNISSIPAFIINNHTLISGSNSISYFEKTLSDLHVLSHIKS